ncbi:MAG: Fluoroacetate dehalogenase [Stenotrophomonas maltophilia]|uniref:Fluoroacetate dehalogenase n=1 Tax=Stenotrophomonas maltophilia TaxID=40324 RepID=A0A7V8JN41_STEMA|nr:MAG: Fluoroacetate dehalogenase [Stenotrophomonas maltophilia]
MTDPTGINRRTFMALAGAAAALPVGNALAAAAPHASAAPPQAPAFVVPPERPGVVPFRVQIPQAALDDLQVRLAAIRWPETETVAGWEQGVPLQAARGLIDHWRHRHDWRQFEQRINAFPQFRTQIDGLGIHFIHARSPHPGALPLLLNHGWPGSVVEFLQTIERLTEPTRFGGRAEDAFHVVVLSMPGYGFSDKPAGQGWGIPRIARAWALLMHERLGYAHWVAQGGDWGAAVTHALASQRPPGLLAGHVNLPLVAPLQRPATPSAEEQRALDTIEVYLDRKAGYADQMNTRPQTIGYALNDSPLALAMWMYEKFGEWSDSSDGPEAALSRDQMLDDIALHWFTGTGASSARLYWESCDARTLRSHTFFSAEPVSLPMAASIFPKETCLAPRSWAKAAWSNLIYWNTVDKGGHFAAFEQPALFARELWRAFANVRSAPSAT